MSLLLAEAVETLKKCVTFPNGRNKGNEQIDSPEDRLVALLAEIQKRKYFGELVLKFENGMLCHGKLTENIMFKS